MFPIILTISFIIFLSIHTFQGYQFEIQPLPAMVTHSGINHLSDIHVSLRQTSKSPLGITITVSNNSSKPVTILTWDSPLDNLALQLGILAITPVDTAKPLDIPTIKISRKLPPGEGSLVGLAPGESRENPILFNELLVPADKINGKTISVGLKGRWRGVWFMARDELTQEAIEALGTSEGGPVSGEFEADPIDIEMD